MKVDQDVAPTPTYEPQAAVAGSSLMTIASSPRSPSSSLSSTGVKISEHEEAYNLRMKHYLGQRYPEVRVGLTTPSLAREVDSLYKSSRRMVYIS